jgi:hypothetical protein
MGYTFTFAASMNAHSEQAVRGDTQGYDATQDLGRVDLIMDAAADPPADTLKINFEAPPGSPCSHDCNPKRAQTIERTNSPTFTL